MAGTVDQKLLRQTKFPPEFNQKVDMQKVNIEVMKKWIASKISEILGTEDDVVTELCFNLLEGSRYPNIKVLQIQLTGFLEKDTATFCKELWNLCLSAQSNPQGVPKELLEAKKLELIQEKIAAEKAAEAVRHRRDQDRARERDLDRVRQRERADRGERNHGHGRGPREDRGYENRSRRDYRDRHASPPSRRRSPDGRRRPSGRRAADTYVPPTGAGTVDRPRKRSPSSSASPDRSASHTPPARRQRKSRSVSTSPPAQSRHTARDANDGNNMEKKGGKDRARNSSSERSPSASPSADYRGRKRSVSSSSRSSPPQPGSKSQKATNATLPRNSEHKRRRNDVSDVQQESHPEARDERLSGNSRSPSSKHRIKRRPSMDRYEPKAKRRRNTSSAEAE